MNIALLGYGKMGKTIEGLASGMGHKIVLKINADNAHERTVENIKKADVAIEFSRPETAFDNVQFCIQNKIPVVSGTTAWLEPMEEAKTFCREEGGAFFYASNFSIGVNIFFALNRYLAGLINSQGQYEVKMTEVHHTQKLDAPSGTAISLAQDILQKLDRKEAWVNEKTTESSKLEILSERVEGVPGTHLVQYLSPIDQIDIQHIAHSREGFAKGAIMAAEWLIGKEGYFEMSDLLGF